MKVGPGGDCHLTYCSNIHPGESWAEVDANLRRYLPQVKSRVSSDNRFGIGLRLSAKAAAELAQPDVMAAFRQFLAEEGLYVFTINGFPYGPFHGTAVKEQVYQPDWMTEERLTYTNQLADIMAALLDDAPDVDGSISTVPGTFKPLVDSDDKIAGMTDVILRHAAYLVDLRARTGKCIALALEPEPFCFLETVAETVDYFRDHLFAEPAVQRLAALTGRTIAESHDDLRRHLGVCLDLCHAAVEFEDPVACVEDLRRAEVPISKVQVTAGLRIPTLSPEALAALRRFDDAVYLHQVVARKPGGLRRFADLPDAFGSVADPLPFEEWRVHFHVPVFMADLDAFESTQSFVEAVLAHHRESPISQHLEVETYTWDVLPERLRTDDIVTAIARELDWTLARVS